MQTVFGFTLATGICDWYASENNFVEFRVVAGRSRTRASSLEKNGMIGDGTGAAWQV